MGNKKKVNPRRIPATQADVNKARQEAIDQAIDISWAISMTVLHDKYEFDRQKLSDYWRYLNSLSDEIAENRVSIIDLVTVLRDEAGIILCGIGEKH